MANRVECGFIGDQRWLSGQIPMRKDVVLEIDTRSGLGIDRVLEHMADTISWHAAKIKLPSSSTEDIVQELNLIVLSAIPEYDITKQANLMTFLQNHLRNRIVNLYKFATERCRTAIHENYRLCKIKCPVCEGFSLIEDSQISTNKCALCGNQGAPGEKWRKYPLPIALVSATERFLVDGEEEGTIQDLVAYEDLAMINASNGTGYVDALISRLALQEFVLSANEQDRLIFQYILEGRNLTEICGLTELSMASLRNRLAGFSKGSRDNN